MKTQHKVRALVLDKKYRVYAIRAHARHVLQLPGGSRKASEDAIKALKREILEETGFKVKICKKITTTIMKRNGMREHTTFYVVQIKGSAQGARLTKAEARRGLRVQRYASVEAFHEALSKRVRRYGRSAVRRDYLLTTAALERR